MNVRDHRVGNDHLVNHRSAVNRAPRAIQQGRARWRIPVLVAVSLLLILLLFRRQVLIDVGQALVVSDPLERADAIYILAGDFWGNRVLLGAKLGSEGWAPKVLVGGGPYGGDGRYHESSELAVDFAVRHGYSRAMFVPVPISASSTIDEVQVLGPIFRRLGVHRVILVTSNFHSRRAAEVFRLYLPEFDFRMEGAPEDDFFDPQAWWNKPQQRKLVLSEYKKMFGTLLVRFHFAKADWLREVNSDVS